LSIDPTSCQEVILQKGKLDEKFKAKAQRKEKQDKQDWEQDKQER